MDDCVRKILDAAGDAFVSIDSGGTIVDWNRHAERAFGWRGEEAIGQPLAGTVFPDDPDDSRAALKRFLATGEGPTDARIEMLAQHRDGYRFPVELSIAPMLDGRQLTFTLFLRDITDRKHMEHRLEEAQFEVLERLARAAEYHDEDTGDHTRRVAQLSGLIAAEYGLEPDTVEMIRRAAPLHDVGKIGVPDALLNKPGKLMPEEFEVVKQHTTIGAAILSGRGFALLETAEQIAVSHHERWDGGGYPYGLPRHAIPLAGQIVGVADVFDALTHRRPYKPAWPRADAIAEIRAQSGRQFAPRVVDAFLRVQVGVQPVRKPRFGASDGRRRATRRSRSARMVHENLPLSVQGSPQQLRNG